MKSYSIKNGCSISYIVFFLICFFANLTQAESLCTDQEKIVFSCPVSKGRQISLCSSDAKDDWFEKKNTYMQYRIGRPQNVEMEYPEKKENPRYNFLSDWGNTFSQYAKSNIDPVNYVGFSKGQFVYYVYSLGGGRGKNGGVAVYRQQQMIANIKCESDYVGDISDLHIFSRDTYSYKGLVPGEMEKLVPLPGSVKFRGLSHPSGIVADGGGNVYIADYGTTLILKVDGKGHIDTYSGQHLHDKFGTVPWYRNGKISDALFGRITRMTVDGDGNLFVIDGDEIREISSKGEAMAFSGYWAGLYGIINAPISHVGYHFGEQGGIDGVSDLLATDKESFYVVDTGSISGGYIRLSEIINNKSSLVYRKKIGNSLDFARVNQFGDVYYVYDGDGINKISRDGEIKKIVRPSGGEDPFDLPMGQRPIGGVSGEHEYAQITDITFGDDGLPIYYDAVNDKVNRIDKNGHVVDFVDINSRGVVNGFMFKGGLLANDKRGGIYVLFGFVRDSKNYFSLLHVERGGKTTQVYLGLGDPDMFGDMSPSYP